MQQNFSRVSILGPIVDKTLSEAKEKEGKRGRRVLVFSGTGAASTWMCSRAQRQLLCRASCASTSELIVSFQVDAFVI